jgi:hypothetical protein
MLAEFHVLLDVLALDLLGEIYQAIIQHFPAHIFKREFVGEAMENFLILLRGLGILFVLKLDVIKIIL